MKTPTMRLVQAMTSRLEALEGWVATLAEQQAVPVGEGWATRQASAALPKLCRSATATTGAAGA